MKTKCSPLYFSFVVELMIVMLENKTKSPLVHVDPVQFNSKTFFKKKMTYDTIELEIYISIYIYIYIWITVTEQTP